MSDSREYGVGKYGVGKYGVELLPTRWGRGAQFLCLDEAGGGASVARAPAAEDTSTEPAGDAGKSFSQADVDRIVKERLEREKAAREKAAQKAREDAEAESLKKNQEWQGLAATQEKRANELAARVTELESVGDQATRYKGALEKYLAAEKKDLPKHVLVLLEKLDPVDQIEYLAANREELGKGGGAPVGVPASPEPKERTLSDEDRERARRGQAQIYQNF